MNIKNILNGIPQEVPDEIFERIISSENIRIERIISKGQSSRENFWYDQDENEWLILIRGKARLKFINEEAIELNKGDYLNIPAHQKHRVEWTDPENVTIWLTVFY